MPLFECPKCGVVENTALGFYWGAETRNEVECSKCHTGDWHGRFEPSYAADGWVEDDPQLAMDGMPPFITRASEGLDRPDVIHPETPIPIFNFHDVEGPTDRHSCDCEICGRPFKTISARLTHMANYHTATQRP